MSIIKLLNLILKFKQYFYEVWIARDVNMGMNLI